MALAHRSGMEALRERAKDRDEAGVKRLVRRQAR
jgi:hypothetical protein